MLHDVRKRSVMVAEFHPELPATVATVVPVLLVAFSYGLVSSAARSALRERPIGPAPFAQNLVDILGSPGRAERFLRVSPVILSESFGWRTEKRTSRIAGQMSTMSDEELWKIGASELSDAEVQKLADLRQMAAAGVPSEELRSQAEELLKPRLEPVVRAGVDSVVIPMTAIVPAAYLIGGLADESLALVALLERQNRFGLSLVILTLVLMAATGLSSLFNVYVGRNVDRSES